MSGKLPEDIDARIEAIFCDDLEGHDGERLVRTLLCDVLDGECREIARILEQCVEETQHLGAGTAGWALAAFRTALASRISRERTPEGGGE